MASKRVSDSQHVRDATSAVPDFDHDRGFASQESEIVPIDSLTATDSPRLAGVNIDHVRTLAECVDQCPPIVVHRPTMRVIDGAHRLHAMRLLGHDTIRVRFFDGNEEEAFVVAVQSNAAHGMPLSLAERRMAASRIVRSYPRWSDRMIASITGLSHKTVGAIRVRSSGEIPHSPFRVGRDGRLQRTHRGKARPTESAGSPPSTPVSEAQAGAAAPSGGRHGEVDTAAPRSDQSASSSTDVVSRLRRDPSLRFTEGGRLLLRLLDACTLGQRHWNQILQSIPAHHVETVMALARESAVSWHSFAHLLARQSDCAEPTDSHLATTDVAG